MLLHTLLPTRAIPATPHHLPDSLPPGYAGAVLAHHQVLIQSGTEFFAHQDLLIRQGVLTAMGSYSHFQDFQIFTGKEAKRKKTSSVSIISEYFRICQRPKSENFFGPQPGSPSSRVSA